MESKKNIIETTIDSVIVYQQGVQITQKGIISLEKGDHILTVTHLPETIDKESIRVKGKGNGKILNIQVEFNSEKKYKKQQYEELQKEKEKIEKKKREFESTLNRIREQIEKIKTTENVFYDEWSTALAYGESNIAKFSEFNVKMNDLVTSHLDSAETTELEMKELQKDLDVLNNKIRQLGSIEEIYNFYEINIDLNVSNPGNFEIETRFTMNDAWWEPFYDLSLTEEDAELSMMANVHNRTDLDWDDIKIEISTASLRPIRLIKPDPFIIKEYIPETSFYGGMVPRPAPSMAPSGPPSGPPMERMDADMDDFKMMDQEEGEIDELLEEPEPIPEIKQDFSNVSDNLGIQVFEVPNRITIPSDENPHPVNLTSLKLQSEKKYYWSSSAPGNVIIRDELENGELLLLPGNVKIYYDEEFLGETTITLTAPKEKFKIGTRVSYDLKVEKKLIDRSKDKKAIRGNLVNEYQYKIMIKNLNDVKEDLVIYDRIPHSSSEKIEIETEEMSLEPIKKKLGVLKWKLNMAGLKEKEIHYKYNVEYKKDIKIRPSLP